MHHPIEAATHLERECAAYIAELGKRVHISTSHYTLINMTAKYGKEEVRQEVDKQFAALRLRHSKVKTATKGQ